MRFLTYGLMKTSNITWVLLQNLHLSIFGGTPTEQIDLTISEASRIRVQKNKKFLISIAKCLELCARQDLALQGHGDEFDSDHFNWRKFRAIIDFHVDADDAVLKHHIASHNCDKRATYISKTSQNNLLKCMDHAILETIVKDGHYYSILAYKVPMFQAWNNLGSPYSY